MVGFTQLEAEEMLPEEQQEDEAGGEEEEGDYLENARRFEGGLGMSGRGDTRYILPDQGGRTLKSWQASLSKEQESAVRTTQRLVETLDEDAMLALLRSMLHSLKGRLSAQEVLTLLTASQAEQALQMLLARFVWDAERVLKGVAAEEVAAKLEAMVLAAIRSERWD